MNEIRRNRCYESEEVEREEERRIEECERGRSTEEVTVNNAGTGRENECWVPPKREEIADR